MIPKGIIFGLHIKQQKLIDEICFNVCKKILFGCVQSDYGTLVLCRQRSCPFEEHNLPIGYLGDETVLLRKLRSKNLETTHPMEENPHE